MKTKRYLFTQVVLSLCVTLLFSNFTQAETINCTAITSVPYTISTQGIYCLSADLSTSMTSGNAITINTNNVVLDLNGHKIGGLGAGTSTNARGIYAYQRQNITIKNGTIRGFYRGIWLDDVSPHETSQGHIIEDIRADMNTWFGIIVCGRGNIIRNNQVVDTGGSSVVSGAYGIAVYGPGNRVINNDVYEIEELTTADSYGIYADSAPGLVVDNNRVGNGALGAGFTHGIQIESSANTMVKDNTISLMKSGIYFDSTGLYMNSLVSGCTTAFTGGTPVGFTNYSMN